MAELALYGNEREPSSTFDLVVQQLSWLRLEFSAGHELDKILPLLDTILVFARARTSTLNYKTDISACQSIMIRLNSVLENIGGEALHHRMELLKRGRGLFFITCKKSPRFNGKTHLTHLDIGRNLDYSCTGYVFEYPFPPRGSIEFFERHSIQSLFSETVLLEVLEDVKVKKELMRFNTAKEEMFNDVMRRFRLCYRFKWVLITPERAKDAAAVMVNVNPPSREWWEDNCVFANGNGIVIRYSPQQI